MDRQRVILRYLDPCEELRLLVFPEAELVLKDRALALALNQSLELLGSRGQGFETPLTDERVFSRSFRFSDRLHHSGQKRVILDDDDQVNVRRGEGFAAGSAEKPPIAEGTAQHRRRRQVL